MSRISGDWHQDWPEKPRRGLILCLATLLSAFGYYRDDGKHSCEQSRSVPFCVIVLVDTQRGINAVKAYVNAEREQTLVEEGLPADTVSGWWLLLVISVF